MLSNFSTMEARPLALTPRQHFFMDPCFSHCWNSMEKEIFHPFSETVRGVLDGKDVSSIKVPWKWNNIGGMMEMYSQNRPEMEKSVDVETLKDSYKILLDVQHFRPEELSISVTDRGIMINGIHEEKNDENGTVSRKFSRKYILPTDVRMDMIECNLSSDGVLHIQAPRKLEEVKEIKDKQISEKKDNDDPMDSQIQTLPDFDMIPFWSRDWPRTDSKFGVKSDKDNFEVLVDARNYTPEELSVHTTPNHIRVEGTHEDKNELGFMNRNFTRKYYFPKGVHPEDIKCNLTSDGVLEIMAPKHLENEIAQPVRVPIAMTEAPVSDNQMDMTATDKDAIIAAEKPAAPAPGY